jgi:ankyrin repeat protein
MIYRKMSQSFGEFQSDIWNNRPLNPSSVLKYATKWTAGSHSRSMLHLAAVAGNIAAMKALLNIGVDPDARMKSGRTPLMETIYYNNVMQRADPTPLCGVIECLLYYQADINAIDARGGTALFYSLHPYGSYGLHAFQLLIRHGAAPSMIIRMYGRDIASIIGGWNYNNLDHKFKLCVTETDEKLGRPPLPT